MDVDRTVDYGNINDASRFVLDEAEDAGEGYETGDSYDRQFFDDTDPDENDDCESLGSEDSDPEVRAVWVECMDTDTSHSTHFTSLLKFPVSRSQKMRFAQLFQPAAPRARRPRAAKKADPVTSSPEVIEIDGSDDEGALNDEGAVPPQTRRGRQAAEQTESDSRFAALYKIGTDKENDGRAVGALDVFLDAVDVNTSDKGMKMELHKKIARLSDGLGWLRENVA